MAETLEPLVKITERIHSLQQELMDLERETEQIKTRVSRIGAYGGSPTGSMVIKNTNEATSRMAKISAHALLPADFPVLPNATYPVVDLYMENPIGTPHNRFLIGNFNGALYFTIIGADDPVTNIFDVFGFVYTSPTDMVVNFKGNLMPFEDDTWKIGDSTQNLSWKEVHVSGTAKLPYATQTGAWAAPADTPPDGSLKVVYNSTQAGSRLYIRSNSAWKYAALT